MIVSRTLSMGAFAFAALVGMTGCTLVNPFDDRASQQSPDDPAAAAPDEPQAPEYQQDRRAHRRHRGHGRRRLGRNGPPNGGFQPGRGAGGPPANDGPPNGNGPDVGQD